MNTGSRRELEKEEKEQEEGERVDEVVKEKQGEGEEQEEATCSDKELDELLDCECPSTNYLILQPGLSCGFT